MNKIKLKTLFVLQVISLIFTLSVIRDINNMQDKIMICRLLQQITYNIKSDVETYIITGNENYLKNLKTNIHVKNGREPWNKILLSNLMLRSYTKEKLENIYKENLSPVDINKYYNPALELYDEILWKVTQSYNWYKGLYDIDNSSESNYVGLNDKHILLFQTPVKTFEQYREYKDSIDKLASEADISMEIKTNDDVLKLNKQLAIDNLHSKETLNFVHNFDILTRDGLKDVSKRNINLINSKIYTVYLLYIILIIMIMITFQSNKYFLLTYNTFIIIYEAITFKRLNLGVTRFDVSTAPLLINHLLTFYARAYVITGNKKWVNKYNNISNIRDGNARWDTIMSIPWWEGKHETLETIYQEAGMNDDEIKKLKKGDDLSRELMWMEIKAINYVKGYMDNQQDRDKFDKMKIKKFFQFSTTIDKVNIDESRNKAIQSLFSTEYFEANSKIKKMNRKSIKEIYQDNLDSDKNVLLTFYIIIIITFVIWLYITFFTRRSRQKTFY